MLSQESRELWAFLGVIHANKYDVSTRLVFADWLDDHDEPEEAQKQRVVKLKRDEAVEFLQKFADQYARGDYTRMVEGVMEGHYSFGDDDGPDEARNDPQFRESICWVVGKEIPDDFFEESSYSCSC